MKQGKPLITFVILAMAAVVALYFAAYIFNAMDDPYRIRQRHGGGPGGPGGPRPPRSARYFGNHPG